MGVIGQSVTRVDALHKVTGEAIYPGDIDMPNQTYMKILFADRPHSKLLSTDKSQAEALDGVILILTAEDVPVNEYGLIMPDQPVLCGPGSDKVDADRVRFIGDQVAVVVAESESIAAEAVKLIQVEYEDLPVVVDPVAAMEQHTELLHPTNESNIFCHYKIRRGNIDEALENSDVVVEAEYHTPAQEHAYLQPEAGVSYIDDEGRVTVLVAGQWTHEEQAQIAHALDLPKDQVRVIYPAIGGAFGGREDMSIQIVLALAAWKLNEFGNPRPVKIVWSREESIVGHHKRHPFVLRTTWGANRDGKLTAARCEVIQDGGAYAYTSTKVLGNATLMVTGPYDIPTLHVDSYSVYTNNIPGGAFRGFGGPQGAFAAESQMSKLAEAIDMDPVEFRLKNVLREGVPSSTGVPLPKGITIDKVIRECANAAGWEEVDNAWERPSVESLGVPDAPHLRRGIGFASAFKNVGFSFGFPEECVATIELYGDAQIDEVVLKHAGAEVGQGNHTVMAQMAADAVGVALDKVRLDLSDTASSSNSGSASASRLTFMAGNSIAGAAEKALAQWRDEERPAVGTFTYNPPRTTPFDSETGEADPNFSYGYVAEAVTVEVDTELGHIRLLNVICADDVGKAINPQQVLGQIEGAIVQAAGYVILEDFKQQNGYVQTEHLSTYLIPGILDIPENVESIILEYADPIGPWGARGMAEMPYLPLAPAITAAVRDALGIWFDEFPLTPERIYRGLQSNKAP